ncbi:MAG: DNA polymerase III subunit delta, partial [Candidatus Methanomethylophilaceae archaeon]
EDKGAVPAIVELIKETRQPVVLIVNDFYGLSRKSSALKTHTLQISFYRPRASETAKILSAIASAQGVQANDRTLMSIAENSQGDIRAAVRDLESLALGRATLVEADTGNLTGRVVRKDMYDLMSSIFRSNDATKAHRTMSEIDESPDYVLLWVDENMPYEFRQPGELVKGYEKLSRADIFLGRVRRRQYYRFWSYASDLMSFGVAQARITRPSHSSRFRFPGYLMKMSRSKSVRNLKDGVTAKIGEHCHTSSSRARQDILPFLQAIAKENASFRCHLVRALDLDADELAFIMDDKIDSPLVKAAMAGEEGPPIRKVPAQEKARPERPEPSKPLPPKGQKSLLQF